MRRSLFLFAFLFFVAGCGQSSFVGKRLDNFTAYYNTFYNAEHAFEEGVRAIETGAENQPVDQNVYLPVFGSSDRPIQGKTFESAIKKSADVLRKHPQSKWVDDALLLIGKARFYTGDYVGAEEKFREVMTLDSRLGDEAHFWLARTLIVSDQYEAAADHLQESLNRESLSKRWEPMFHLALGEMYVQRSAWEDATAELEAGLESVKDNAVAARAQFLLGQVYESLGRYAEAVASYERVVRYNPFYELSYAAQVSAIRVEGLYGDTDAALRMLRRMERDDKNYANRAELAYLRGRIYQAAGHADDALDTYYEVLYDSDANITPVRGRVHYALGELYRDLYVDYSLAAAHFDTAAVALQGTSGRGGRRVGNVPGTARQQAFAPSAITDGNEQQRTFRSFADVMDQTSRMDSLLYLGSLDEEAFEARVLELRQEEAERLAEEQARMERLRAERQFQNAGNFNQRGRNNRGESKQTGSSQREDNSAGFLFHRDQARVQEGRADFTLRWGDRPLVPNWRRAAALSNLTGEEAEGGGGVPADENLDLPGAGLPEIDIASVPRDSLSRRQMRADRAVARYELANVLFLSMNRPDSAAVWYRMVIEEDGDEPVAQRAYYALAEVQRALGDTLSARRLYQTILDTYPDSDFAGRARERLGLPETIVISDSLVLAEEAYDRAYGAWRSAAYEQSLNEMVDMAIRYSQTDVAPRALFAAGSIYMEWATRDSLSLFDPLPLAIPDSVIQASLLFQPPPVPIQQQARGNIPPRRGTTQELQAGLPPGKVIDVSEDRQGLPPGKVIDTPTEQDDLPPGNVIGPAPAGVDSLAADSLAQTEEIIADSLAGPEKAHLETLYTALRAWYPRSLQAPQAGRILNVLKERQAEIQAVADSLAALDSLAVPGSLTVPDSLAALTPVSADSAQATPPEVKKQARLNPSDVVRASEQRREERADSSAEMQRRDRLQQMLEQRRNRLRNRREPPPDSLSVPADSTGVEPDTTDTLPQAVLPRPSRSPSPRDDGSIDWSKGGWTILIRSSPMKQQADVFVRHYRTLLRDTGHPVDVFSTLVQEAMEYRVGVGLFDTEEGAREALASLAAQLPEDAQVVRVPPAP